jgi:2-oxoglutarate dehydrogenase E2 component (dihydrolipoamide succinyltransferase)
MDIVVPQEQEGSKTIVKSWLKKVGDRVTENEPLVELETDKVAVEIAATANGVLSEIIAAEGAEVEPGTILGRLSPKEFPRSAQEEKIAPSRESDAHGSRAEATRLAPGIRRLLAEHGLSASDMSGNLTREAILAEAARRAKAARPGVIVAPHDSMRRNIAEHMSRSVQTAPHVTAVFEADMTAVLVHRDAHKETFARDGASLTLTAYLVVASAAAMRAAPAVNGRWFDDRLEIYEDVNIGVGTALGERGLIVPVIHGAQSLSLIEIAGKLTELTKKAREGRLSPAEVQNGTFSISNHGVSGSLLAAPIIINQPQVAILGIGKLEKRAVVREIDAADCIAIRPMAYVSLTIDHRTIDAYQTNAWLTAFVQTLERWPA